MKVRWNHIYVTLVREMYLRYIQCISSSRLDVLNIVTDRKSKYLSSEERFWGWGEGGGWRGTYHLDKKSDSSMIRGPSPVSTQVYLIDGLETTLGLGMKILSPGRVNTGIEIIHRCCWQSGLLPGSAISNTVFSSFLQLANRLSAASKDVSLRYLFHPPKAVVSPD